MPNSVLTNMSKTLPLRASLLRRRQVCKQIKMLVFQGWERGHNEAQRRLNSMDRGAEVLEEAL